MRREGGGRERGEKGGTGVRWWVEWGEGWDREGGWEERKGKEWVGKGNGVLKGVTEKALGAKVLIF